MVESAELTELGNEVIPVELVGQNIAYEVLKESKSPYPKGNEVRYSDGYLEKINEIYSLTDILGERMQGIKERKSNAIASIVMGSPLRNAEGEDVLAYMLINSAEAGLWQPSIIDVPKLTDTQISTAREYLERVESISPTYNKGMIEGGFLFGLSVAKRGNFALPIEHDNKVIIVPSQDFVEYCAMQK
ncbi:hypothetical protein ACFL6I_18475 [candidate division KSB1 bacterium]